MLCHPQKFPIYHFFFVESKEYLCNENVECEIHRHTNNKNRFFTSILDHLEKNLRSSFFSYIFFCDSSAESRVCMRDGECVYDTHINIIFRIEKNEGMGMKKRVK